MDFYYIDKTGLIEELLKTNATQVTLITRPRRFGKTLGMSMMAEFLTSEKTAEHYLKGFQFQIIKNCVRIG